MESVGIIFQDFYLKRLTIVWVLNLDSCHNEYEGIELIKEIPQFFFSPKDISRWASAMNMIDKWVSYGFSKLSLAHGA